MFNQILMTVEYMKAGDFPAIFQEKGQFYEADYEIMENHFFTKDFFSHVLDDIEKYSADKLITQGRIWYITQENKPKKVYIFNIEFEDLHSLTHLEDVRLDLKYYLDDAENLTYEKRENATFWVYDLELQEGF